MAILVQKFGGTSVADAHRIHLAARRAVRAKLEGCQIVLVVSAMGDTTDRLLRLARQVSSRPSKREMDMLLSTGEQVSIALMAMAIHEAGHEAVSLTGAQVGLRTDSRHTAARIRRIDTAAIRRHLDAGRMVIVAGFQGVDEDFNITTLGRGGSDTTAVALAAALRAKACEVYTDVGGVFTADPRLVPQARKIDRIGYDEMLELASLGAGVMHARALELGKRFDVPIHVRSSFDDAPGTWIVNEPPDMETADVRGVTLKRGLGRVSLQGLPNEPRVVGAVLEQIAARDIVVDDIIQTVVSHGQILHISFTVAAEHLGRAEAAAQAVLETFPGATLEVDDGLARVSAVGVGMRTHSGVAARMFSALGAAGVRVESISTSEIVISALVRATCAERALQAVHAAFGLERSAPARV